MTLKDKDVERIHTRLDHIEVKLDAALISTARSEEKAVANSDRLTVVSGHVKILGTLILSALGWLASQYLMIKGG